jgi:SAM-dependent methyltransferase
MNKFKSRLYSGLYEVFQLISGGHGLRKEGIRKLLRFVDVDTKPRILDLGCADGEMLRFLPEGAYVGVDNNFTSIKRARRRFGSKYKFVCQDVAASGNEYSGEYDLILMAGLLHHMSDSDAESLLKILAGICTPETIIVCVDPVYFEGQGVISRLLCKLDLGRFVRTESQYRDLLPSGLAVQKRDFIYHTHILGHKLLFLVLKGSK